MLKMGHAIIKISSALQHVCGINVYCIPKIGRRLFIYSGASHLFLGYQGHPTCVTLLYCTLLCLKKTTSQNHSYVHRFVFQGVNSQDTSEDFLWTMKITCHNISFPRKAFLNYLSSEGPQPFQSSHNIDKIKKKKQILQFETQETKQC